MAPATPDVEGLDTIAAIATPLGSGGIGILRVSGGDAWEVVHPLLSAPGGGSLAPPAPRTMVRADLYGDPRHQERLDHILVVRFPGPRSYTGEDVVELHCHSSAAVLRAALRALIDRGARLAEPGEFTRRAFLQGRLDLSQAEAVARLIAARTDAARRVALAQLDGGLSEQLTAVARRLLEARAHIEALIDFAEEDGEAYDLRLVGEHVAWARDQLTRVIDRGALGRRLSEGLRIVLAGRPNVGKSTLLNALLGQQRALVSPFPGTTRDYLEAPLTIGGLGCTLVDTAGLREAGGPLERLGMERSRQQLDRADLILMVADAAAGWTAADRSALAAARPATPDAAPIVLVWNKIDLCASPPESGPPGEGLLGAVALSARTGRGLDGLHELIAHWALAGAGDRSGELFLVDARQHEALRAALVELARAADNLAAGAPLELTAFDLARATDALGRITGETTTEDVLDLIFSTFCIGK